MCATKAHRRISSAKMENCGVITHAKAFALMWGILKLPQYVHQKAVLSSPLYSTQEYMEMSKSAGDHTSHPGAPRHRSLTPTERLRRCLWLLIWTLFFRWDCRRSIWAMRLPSRECGSSRPMSTRPYSCSHRQRKFSTEIANEQHLAWQCCR